MLDVLKKDMICRGLLILNGIFLLICPILGWTFFLELFVGTMIFYAVVNAVLFLLTMKSKDYTSAFTCLASLIIGIIGYLYKVTETPKFLAITILIWLLMLSLIKLKKADMYHDKKSKMWQFETVLLFLFVITGILTSINFLFGLETNIIVFGYFILITGIFEFLDPFLAYITKGKIK